MSSESFEAPKLQIHPAESVESDKKVINLVYRGDNPYLDKLGAELISLGHTIHVHKCPVTLKQSEFPAFVSNLGSLEGNVVTDRTLFDTAKKVVGDNVINAYSLVKWKMESREEVADYVRPIIEEIRAAGRSPVVLHRWLGDHFETSQNIAQSVMSSSEYKQFESATVYGEEQSTKKSSDVYASILSADLGLSVITKEEFGGGENILEILGKKDILGAVILVDHHVYEMREDQINENGFDNVEIVPICPCCIGNSAMYADSLKDAGFNLYPLSYKAEVAQNAIKLIDSLS